MKKNAKSPTKKTDRERETRVLLEDIRHSVKTIAEGHSAILQKLDINNQCLTGVDTRLTRVEMVVTDTNARLKAHEKKLDTHETRITKLEEKVPA